MLKGAHAHSDSIVNSERHSDAILSEGGVVQVGDIYNNNSAHVDGSEVVQVGDLIYQPNPQCQGEGLRKVIVHRGLKRKRS